MANWTPNLTGISVLACPTCHGFGFELTPAKKHILCPQCKHIDSVVGVLPDMVLFFSRRMNRVATFGRRALQWFNRLIDLMALLGALVCVGYFGYELMQQIGMQADVVHWFTTPHEAERWLWIGALCLLFVIYRVTHTSEMLKRLPPLGLFESSAKSLNGVNQWTAAHQLKGSVKVNLDQYMAEDGLRAIEDGVLLANNLNHNSVQPIHVFISALKAPAAAVMLGRLGVDQNKLVKKLGSALQRLELKQNKKAEVEVSAAVRASIILAGFFARRDERPRISATQLIQATLSKDLLLQEVMNELEIDVQAVFNTVEWLHIQSNIRDRLSHWRATRGAKPKGIMNRAMTARPTPTLDSIGQDYTLLARSGRFSLRFGGDKEMLEAFRILKEGTGNVLLVGEPGAGKTTLLEGIAELMTTEDVPTQLQDKRFVVIDPGALVAGAAGIGSLEQRMTSMVKEIIKAGNILLGIEDIHHLLGASSVGGTEDVGHAFMNYLSQGYLHVVATTTTEEFQKYIQPQETFLRRFQVVKVSEMSKEDALRVLMGRSGSIEYKTKAFFSYAALAACVELSSRYIKDRYLPAKALDIMEEAALLSAEERGERTLVTQEDVAKVVSEKTNVPVTGVSGSEATKLLHLEELMHQRIVGQDDAVNAVASAMRRAREELRDAGRPIASFLFLGPTGVGKTETAKTLAEVYFGQESHMIRIDMSEFQDQFSLHKMIGAPGQQGQLTEAVRLKPFSVVLFDEVEKAHPDVLNILLQILDDGRLTEGTGKTIDFTNTIVIATSNAASQQIQAGLTGGQSMEQIKRQLLEVDLLTKFRPELLNRFDHIAVFTPLSFNEIIEVTKRLLLGVAKQLEKKGMSFEFTEQAVQDLATKGYDPKFGARPLRRLIQDSVNDSIAKLLLQEKINRRDVIVLDAGGVVTIKKAKPL